MPNNCYNTIIITGDPTLLEKVKKQIKTTKRSFDFNKIISNKKHLQKKKKDWRKLSAEEKGKWKNRQYGPRRRNGAFMNWWFNNGGHEWQCNHWGTKWNAYDISERHLQDLNYNFTTAWGPAIPVLISLSKRFPEINILLCYSIEGGNGCGNMKINKGEVIDHHEWNPEIFQCPECENWFEENPDNIGEFVSCPECEHKIHVEKYKISREI